MFLINVVSLLKWGWVYKHLFWQYVHALYLDVLDPGEPSAWHLGPDLDVVDHLGEQPEGFSSLLLDVGGL